LPRLRRSDPSRPGLTRRAAGRGFAYLDASGARVTDAEALERIRALAIPPAWRDVWISTDAVGHIQAVGTDAAGRRQYLYHEQWRTHRDREKHRHALELGAALPAMRRRWRSHLRRPGLDRERVLAAAATLLDLGLFRIGGEQYAAEHGTYGLATLRRSHVRVRDGALVFDYTAKAGLRRVETVRDPGVLAVVEGLRRRRDENAELFAYKVDGVWYDVRSADVNDYLRQTSTVDVTAKDFRTWHATVLMAAELAQHAPVPTAVTTRRRLVNAALREVSGALGNTPAVCRKSYVDPKVVDLFHAGVTMTPPAGRQRGDRAFGHAVERAVLDLLRA
jgi:DNA topoisomerase IB